MPSSASVRASSASTPASLRSPAAWASAAAGKATTSARPNAQARCASTQPVERRSCFFLSASPIALLLESPGLRESPQLSRRRLRRRRPCSTMRPRATSIVRRSPKAPGVRVPRRSGLGGTERAEQRLPFAHRPHRFPPRSGLRPPASCRWRTAATRPGAISGDGRHPLLRRAIRGRSRSPPARLNSRPRRGRSGRSCNGRRRARGRVPRR